MIEYTIFVGNRTLIENKKEGIWDWDESEPNQEKRVETHKTLKECFESMENWGSRFAMYPAVWIEEVKDGELDGEVWESTPMHSVCKHCGHEEWERAESFVTSEYKEMANA